MGEPRMRQQFNLKKHPTVDTPFQDLNMGLQWKGGGVGGGQNKGRSTSRHFSMSAGVDSQRDLTLPVLTPQLFQGHCLTVTSYDDYEDTQ